MPDAQVIDAGAPDAVDEDEVEALETMCGAVPTTLAEWEACYLKRYCEALAYCGGQSLYSDAQECIAELDAVSGGRLAFEAFGRERAIQAGNASLDAAEFTKCLNGLSASHCMNPRWVAGCETRFTGTIPDGESCHSDIECMSPGARCEAQTCGDSCCMGTCQPRAKLGEPCKDFEACEPGLMCSVNSSTCVHGDVGAACENNYDCLPTTWCDRGTCKPLLGEGAPCTSILECGGRTSCVGLRSEVEAPTCRRVTEVGDACDWFCRGNQYCDLSNPQGLGVCRSLPKLGEPCSELAGCIGRSNYCAEGTCTIRPGLDEPCSGAVCQPGLFCTDQLGASTPTCQPRMPDGTAGCNQPTQCESYVCNGDETAPGECQPLQSTCP